MKHVAFVLLLVACVLVVPTSAPADDASPDEAKIADLTSRLARLQEELTALQQELAALKAHPARAEPLAWTKLVDEEHLKARLTAAAKERQPVVVFVWAEWCSYCKAYQRLIEQDPELREGFADLVRLEIDVTQDPSAGLRHAAGLPEGGQPRMVFFDAKGKPVGEAAVDEWHGEESAGVLKHGLELLDLLAR